MDLIGKKFGRLRVLEFSHSDSKSRFWKCTCKCGKEVIKRTSGLVSNRVKSCGCLKRQVKGSQLEGKQRGQVYIIKDTGKSTKRGRIIYSCECLVCGRLFEKKVQKNMKSCGCLRFHNLSSYPFWDRVVIAERRDKIAMIEKKVELILAGRSVPMVKKVININEYFEDHSPCHGCQFVGRDKEQCYRDCSSLAEYRRLTSYDKA